MANPAIVASGDTSPLGAAGYSVRLLADRLATHRLPWPSMVTADGLASPVCEPRSVAIGRASPLAPGA